MAQNKKPYFNSNSRLKHKNASQKILLDSLFQLFSIAKFVPSGSIGNFISTTNHTWRRTTYQQCL